MKLNQKTPNSKLDPGQKLSDELIFDQTFFAKHNMFLANIDDKDNLYIVPACDVESIRILKIENASRDSRLVESNGKQIDSATVMHLLSDLINGRKIQLKEFEPNLLKNNSKQITFKAI